MSKLKSIQAQVQETIEKTIETVEKQHIALASKPFDYAMKLEKEAKSYSVTDLREKHDKAIDAMYDTLLTVNKKVNDKLAGLISRIDGEEEVTETVEKETKKAAGKAAKKAEEAGNKVEEAIS